VRDLSRLRYLLRWAQLNKTFERVPASGIHVPLRDSVTRYQIPVAGAEFRRVNNPHGNPVAKLLVGSQEIQIGAEGLDDAEKLEIALETLFQERPPVWESPDLSDAIQQALSHARRDDVKSRFNKVVTGPMDTDEYTHWMNFTLGLAEGECSKESRTEMVLGHYITTTYIFKGTEAQAISSLEGLRDVKRMPTPRRVLVKMVHLRMSKMRKEVEEENNRRRKQRAEDALQASLPPNDPNKQKNYHPSGKPDVIIGDLDNRANCKMSASKANYDAGYWTIRREAENLMKCLQREDIDDSIIHDAWKLYLVGDVMQS